MTLRQQFLRIVYPFWLFVTRMITKRYAIRYNAKEIPPVVSPYSLTITLNTTEEVALQKWKGKKLLLVNTASDCGYTAQYSELQQLYEAYRDQLMIIGFPSNDFKEQEKGSDEAIAQFCRTHFGVSFPLVKKTVVQKGPHQHPVFQWLTDKARNGWNDLSPDWNFSKYLINEHGVLTHYFGPSVSPLSTAVLRAVQD